MLSSFLRGTQAIEIRSPMLASAPPPLIRHRRVYPTHGGPAEQSARRSRSSVSVGVVALVVQHSVHPPALPRRPINPSLSHSPAQRLRSPFITVWYTVYRNRNRWGLLPGQTISSSVGTRCTSHGGSLGRHHDAEPERGRRENLDVSPPGWDAGPDGPSHALSR